MAHSSSQWRGGNGIVDITVTIYEGWPADAVRLVERAIAAHGGLDRWRDTTSIRLPFAHGTGPLLRLKGFRDTFPAPREYEVRPHEGTTILHGYPDDQHRGRFSVGNVSIERADGSGAPIVSVAHRGTLRGLAKYRRWSPLDALYFFGYALWHYHTLPFTLPQARLLRVLTVRDVPAGVDVLFPHDVITHCRRQQFYFGRDGRVARHDYVADVIGIWARGAHFWEDYQDADGLAIARRRRVVVRIGRRPTPIPVLCIQLGEASRQQQPPPATAPGSTGG
jgi:hypothetical protein